MKCPVCEVETDTEVHKVDCPYVGESSPEVVLNQFVTSGWECPRCKRILGPLVRECESCNSKINKGIKP